MESWNIFDFINAWLGFRYCTFFKIFCIHLHSSLLWNRQNCPILTILNLLSKSARFCGHPFTIWVVKIRLKRLNIQTGLRVWFQSSSASPLVHYAARSGYRSSCINLWCIDKSFLGQKLIFVAAVVFPKNEVYTHSISKQKCSETSSTGSIIDDIAACYKLVFGQVLRDLKSYYIFMDEVTLQFFAILFSLIPIPFR